jgi:ribonuclease E
VEKDAPKPRRSRRRRVSADDGEPAPGRAAAEEAPPAEKPKPRTRRRAAPKAGSLEAASEAVRAAVREASGDEAA